MGLSYPKSATNKTFKKEGGGREKGVKETRQDAMGPIQFLEIKLLIPESALTTDSYSKFFILFFLFPPPPATVNLSPPKSLRFLGDLTKPLGQKKSPLR